MDFVNALKMELKKSEITLGYNKDEQLIIDIEKNPSIIITGSTGTGKSILLDQILLQLMNKYTSLEMGIVSIDTSGIELLSYTKTPYTLFHALNDKTKSSEAIFKVLREIERRKKLLEEKKVLNVEDYNRISSKKLPMLVLAIDDDKLLLRDKDIDSMLSGIITQLRDLNIVCILATSDVYNSFFETDKNILASVLISFDYTSNDEATRANIDGINNLPIGSFAARINGVSKIYNNYEFDDSTIEEIIK